MKINVLTTITFLISLLLLTNINSLSESSRNNLQKLGNVKSSSKLITTVKAHQSVLLSGETLIKGGSLVSSNSLTSLSCKLTEI
jgi:hypothetical protein